MNQTERLQWLVSADGNAAIKAFKSIGDSADTNLGKAEQRMDKLSSGFLKFGAGALASAGILGGALVKTAGSFEQLGIQAGKFSSAAGISVQDASRLIEVTGDLGVSSDSLQTALNKMNKTIGASPQKFAEFGVQIAKTKDGNTDVVGTFDNVIDRLDAIPDAGKRAEAATALLGKGWAENTEIIAGGSAKLKAAMAAVSDAKIIDPGEEASAKDYRASLDALKDSFEDLTLSIGKGAAPVIGGIAKTIGVVVEAFDKLDSISGGFVGTAAAVGAVAVGIAGLASVAVGAGVKMADNLGLLGTKLGLKSAAEVVDTAAVESNTAANAAAVAAIDGRTVAVEADTVAVEENAAAQKESGIVGAGLGAGLVVTGLAMYAFGKQASQAADRAKDLTNAIGETSTAADEDLGKVMTRLIADSLLTGGHAFDDLAKTNITGALRLRDWAKTAGIADGVVGELTKSIDKANAATAQGAATTAEYTGEADQLGDVFTIAANTQGAYGEAAELAGDKAANAAEQIAGTGDVYTVGAKAQQLFADQQAATSAALTANLEAQTTTANETRVAWLDYAHALGLASTTVTAQKAAQDAFSASLDAGANAASADLRAHLALNEGYDKLTASVKANGKGVDENTEKGRANIAAILDVGAAIRGDLTEQLRDAGGSYEAVTASADLYRQQLVKQLTQAGLTKDQIAEYIHTLGLTPEQIETSIKLSGQAAAKATLDTLNVDLDKIPPEKRLDYIAALETGDFEAGLKIVKDTTVPPIDVPLSVDTGVIIPAIEAVNPPDLHVGADTAEAKAAIHRLDGTVVRVNLRAAAGLEYATGTKAAKPGLAEVAEDGAEIIQGKDGARLVKKRSLVMLKGGERIYNGRETAAILAGGAGTGPGNAIPGYSGGAFGGTYDQSQVVVTRTPASGSSSSADAVTAEQDRIQAAQYETGRISLDAYKQYVQGRLAESKDLSDDYLTQFRLLRQLADTEKQSADDRAQAAQDAADAEKKAAADAISAQDDVMKNMHDLNVISDAEYEDYLKGRLGSFQAYTDGYTAIAQQIKQMEDQQVSDRVKVAQDQADKELAIYKQLQANKAVVDAEAEQARQTAQTFATGVKGGKIMGDRHSSAEDRAQAVQDLEDDQSKLADATWNTIKAKADAANLAVGTVDWDRLVRGLLMAAIDNFNGAGLTVSAALLGGQLSGVPALATGGTVKGTAAGTLAIIGDKNRDEHIVRDDPLRTLTAAVTAMASQTRGNSVQYITLNMPAGSDANANVTALRRHDRRNGTSSGYRPLRVAVGR